MEDQNQRRIETLASQMPECLEERRDKDSATRPYHFPQVFLVGKAKHLIAGHGGINADSSGSGYYLPS
jgi:hypothetical protein